MRDDSRRYGSERYIASLQFQTPLGEHWELMAGGNWNRWFDYYQWHRGTSPDEENFHKVDAAGLHANIGYNTASFSLAYSSREASA